MNKPEYIILHHFGGTSADPSFDTSNQTLEIIDAWHKTLWPNFASRSGHHCGYHIIIEKTGIIRRAREDDEVGAHVVSMNDKSLGIALAGNFDRLPSLPNSKPTKEQEDSSRKLLKELVLKYNLTPNKIVNHRFFSIKSCPGKNLSDSWGRDLIKEELPATQDIEKQLTLIQQLIESLKLLIIRWQNKLGGNKYV